MYADKSNGVLITYREFLQSAMRAGSPDRVTFYEEYMDLSQYPGENYRELIRNFYRQKYLGQKFDLIFAQAPSVLNFLSKYGDELFPGTPIVFGTLDKSRIEGINLGSNITGVLSDFDFGRTLEAALRMQPDVRNVVVVSGASPPDANYLAKARTQFRSFEGRVELTYLTALPMDELEKRLANLPPHTITFYVTIVRDGAGQTFTALDSLTRVASVSSVPTYSFLDRFLDAGSVGGFVWSAEADADEVAKVGLRILAGEKPADIPIHAGNSNRYMFNWQQLRRWGIDERGLPPGSIVVHRVPSFWETYKWRIVGVSLLCILEAVLIVLLLINRLRIRRAEAEKAKLAAIVESSDDAIWSKTLDGTITSWNAGAEKMYEYPASEILGKNVSILFPTVPKTEFEETLGGINRGATVEHLETDCLTRNGRRIAVSLTISSIRNAHGVITGASTVARDITDRNRSQRALQQLSGRLLMLQDEERKRVAAELHDGLGQNLAIIKNRAMIGLRDQTNDGAAREQLQEIAATATASISEVREIAHNLRPYELDRLGLVSAIESMIERVSNLTTIQLSASLAPIDGLLSPEAETSVYRVVQESLNNLLKHSKATRARIDIKKSDKQIVITIQDDGVGIPAPVPAGSGHREKGFGLVGIAERVRVLGGSLALDSQPSRGTTVNVTLELANGTPE